MLNKLTERIYYMTQREDTDRPVIGLVIGDAYSLVVDAGASPKHAKEFLESTLPLSISPLKYLVITHWHHDHIFGITTMNLTTICHVKTRNMLNELNSQKWDDASLDKMKAEGQINEFLLYCIKEEMPDQNERIIGNCDIYFENRIEIDLGGITCIIENIGGDHTEDSSVLYVPDEKVLFLGDCIYGGRYNGVYGYTLDKLTKLVNKIKSYDASYFLVSHRDPDSMDALYKILDGLMSIGEAIGDEKDTGAAIDNFKKVFKRDPKGDEVDYINYFAGVNRVINK